METQHERYPRYDGHNRKGGKTTIQDLKTRARRRFWHRIVRTLEDEWEERYPFLLAQLHQG